MWGDGEAREHGVGVYQVDDLFVVGCFVSLGVLGVDAMVRYSDDAKRKK